MILGKYFVCFPTLEPKPKLWETFLCALAAGEHTLLARAAFHPVAPVGPSASTLVCVTSLLGPWESPGGHRLGSRV